MRCSRAHLLTLGRPIPRVARSNAGDPTCFDTLRECRDAVASALGLQAQDLELSMGMSGDFEAAISKGSNSVRVGSSIFGARDYPAKE